MPSSKSVLDRGEGLPRLYQETTSSTMPDRPRPRQGYASGAFGPTTAGRMDPYVPLFQAQGASMVMLAKGNRSKQVTGCLQEVWRILSGLHRRSGGPSGQGLHHSGGGVEFPELGMEAIYMITVKDFPAFILWTTRATISSRACFRLLPPRNLALINHTACRQSPAGRMVLV